MISPPAILRELAEAAGAPGAERAVRTILERELKRCGPLRHDRLGSVICERTGTSDGPVVMLTAHMDEVAFAVQSITRNGFIKIVALGGWWTHNLLAQRVKVVTSTGREILGVISSTPPHFLSDAQRDKVMSMEQLFVDVGAVNADEVGKMGVCLGDAVLPVSEFTVLTNADRFMCKAFDNRVGCAVMVETMRRLQHVKLPCRLSAVGTVQEEVGCRGAVTAAEVLKPDIALVLEGTPADDTPGMDVSEAQGALGGGPQIRLLDPTALMNRPLVDHIRNLATRKRITHQLAVRRSGGTDARSIQLSGFGVPTVVVGVPVRYIHSHNSILQLQDYENTIQLMVQVIKTLNAAAVAGFTNY